MTTPLMYGTKEMKLDAEDWELSDIARILRGGKPMVVSLEPGDATNYTLLLVPCWSAFVEETLGRYGIPPSSSKDYLFISKLSGEACPGQFVRPPCQEFDFEFISPDEWTRMFLAWWVSELWTRVKA